MAENGGGGGGDGGLASQYPPPPPYYELYADASVGPPPPPPPAVADGDAGATGGGRDVVAGSDGGAYEAFGARFALRPKAPSLAEGGVPVLYDATAATAGGAAAKRELQALHRSLVFNYVELVRALADEPTQAAERVEGVGHVARNLHHLINALRPVQAKATLLYILRSQIADKKKALEDVRARAAEMDAFLAEEGERGKELGPAEGSRGGEGAGPGGAHQMDEAG